VARRAALAGHGIARLSGIHVVDDLREGRLTQVLTGFPTRPVPIHLVYPTRRHLASRTRVVMDFLAEQIEGAKEMLAEGRGRRVSHIAGQAD
jgi:DNA-binding transcriptional LysR family regulator